MFACRRWLSALAVLLALAIAPSAQEAGRPFFAVLADTQFGYFAGDRDFVQETANYEFVVANLNRLRPSFVVVCGDLINKPGDPAQTAEYLRITSTVDPAIRVYGVPGNHDVGNEPTPESLAYYRQHFGPNYYGFREGDVYGIVLDSSLISAPAKTQAAADEQEAWLGTELEKARASGARHIVVFQHHSWFLEQPDEPTAYFNIPIDTRRRYLDRLKRSGVRYVFAGHYHRNAHGRDDDLEMVTTGPVGRPLGSDPSGIRLVSITDTGLDHTYFGLGTIPGQFPVRPVTPVGR
jgi:3',5'-cyclic AMP phosphodiesterase CpdA